MSFNRAKGPTGPPVQNAARRRCPTSPAGILAAMGILAAYTHRLKTGPGPMGRNLPVRGSTRSDLLAGPPIALATGVGAGKRWARPTRLNAPYQGVRDLR